MLTISEKQLGYGLGLLGALLFVLAGLVSLFVGALDLVVGRAPGVLGYETQGLVLIVVGALSGVFAHLGYHQWRTHPLSSGALLVIVSALGWATLGLGGNALALIGAILVFLAGVLYLIEPVQTRVTTPAPA